MKLAQSTIDRVLKKLNYPDSNWNIMTIEDALQWEDEEDYDTLEDCLNNVIESQESELHES